MSTIQRILNQIEQALPLEQWLPFRIIVAVSGGADSVALLHLLKRLSRRHSDPQPANLIVAHFNHGLRGNQSDQEEALVRDLARSLELDFHSVKLGAACHSSEENLRDHRYRFLVELAHQQGARMIATGHQANDQAETILFRICRGTGIYGLTGIPKISVLESGVTVIRPLLEIWRNEIEDVLTELGQDFCNDLSNNETHYSRNFLRQEIMPSIAERFGRSFPIQLLRLAQQARETEEFFDDQTRSFRTYLLACSKQKIEIDCRQLQTQPDLLVRHFLKLLWTEQGWPQQKMTFEKWQQLSSMARQEVSAVLSFPGKIEATMAHSKLILSRR